MSVRVNVWMSKIMRTPIKVGVRTYATYANCRTLTYIKLYGKVGVFPLKLFNSKL